MDNQYIINPLSLHAILNFSFFFRYISFRFVRFVSFFSLHFVPLSYISFRFVSFGFVWFRLVWFRFVSISFCTLQVPHCTLSKTKTQCNMLVLWMFYVRYWKQIFNVYPLKWPYLISAIIKIPQMKIPLEADYGWVECIVLINWLICYSRVAYPSGAHRFISVVLVNA